MFGMFKKEDDVSSIMQKIRKIYKKDGVEDALMMSQVTGQVSLTHADDIRKINNLIQKLCRLKGTTVENIMDELDN